MKHEETPFKHPISVEEIVIETDLMREMETRVLAMHHLCLLCLWYGSGGVGKTTTAEWMTRRANAAFTPQNPHAFKVVLYEVAKLKAGFGNETKRAIRSLYAAVSGMTVDEGYYGRCTAEEFADLVIDIAERQRVQLVFVDEAGLLSLDAIGGLILVSDKARQRKFPVTIVLIGMDDLPQKVKLRPQIRRRVPEWCHFQHYDLEQTYKLLRALHPHFAALNRDVVPDWEQVKFVHEISEGLPGYIIPFVSQFDAQYRGSRMIINKAFLRAVHLRTVYDTRDILAQSKRNGNSKTAAAETAAVDETADESAAERKKAAAKKRADAKRMEKRRNAAAKQAGGLLGR